MMQKNKKENIILFRMRKWCMKDWSPYCLYLSDDDKKDKDDSFDIDLDFEDLFKNDPPIDEPLLPFEQDKSDEKTVKTCMHINKYLNRVSPSLSFWYCPDCKKEIKE